MRFSVLSDLHIRDAQDPLYARLLAWIPAEAGAPGDVLVLAGDIFDLYLGDRRVFRERYAEFHAALARAGKQGATIHYLQGNHDFLLERTFGAVPGMHVWPSEVRVQIDGVPIAVAHGDLVDPEDKGYRVLRALFRSPLMRLLNALLPDAWLEAIGKRSSLESQKHRVRLPEQLPPERLARLRACYHAAAERYFTQGVRHVVMGHCHDRDERRWSLPQGECTYWNVGLPRVHGTAIRWDPSALELRRVPF